MPKYKELSLGAELIDRVQFGDDTMQARFGEKYKNLKPGDKIVFVPRHESGGEITRIKSEIVENRQIRLIDIFRLKRGELRQAGATSAGRLYDSQFHWYGDRINERSPFHLIFYKPPPEAADLRIVRDLLTRRLKSFKNLDVENLKFSFHPRSDEFEWGPAPPGDVPEEGKRKRGPMVAVDFTFDLRDQDGPGEESLFDWLEETFPAYIGVDPNNQGCVQITQNGGPWNYTVALPGSPAALRKTLEKDAADNPRLRTRTVLRGPLP